jgi:hypothetical protein
MLLYPLFINYLFYCYFRGYLLSMVYGLRSIMWVRPPFVVVVCVYTYLPTYINLLLHTCCTYLVARHLPPSSYPREEDIHTSLFPYKKLYFRSLEFLRCGCGRLPIPRGFFPSLNDSVAVLYQRRIT